MSISSLRIVAIGGSVRPDNFTMQALRVVTQHLETLPGVEVSTIDPATVDWPLPGREGDDPGIAKAQSLVESADGVILATPEYHGSVSSVLKLVIENLGFPSRLAGKPIALVGVAAGAIGAIQSLGQLRQIGSHVGGLVLPGAVSIAGVHQVFEDGKITDSATEGRLTKLGDGLISYLRETTCPSI